jgi:hypothetical protein
LVPGGKSATKSATKTPKEDDSVDDLPIFSSFRRVKKPSLMTTGRQYVVVLKPEQRRENPICLMISL